MSYSQITESKGHVIQHRSVAYVGTLKERVSWNRIQPITDQFRFLVRLAVACHETGTPYNVQWYSPVECRSQWLRPGEWGYCLSGANRIAAAIEVTGTAIPKAKRLPKVVAA